MHPIDQAFHKELFISKTDTCNHAAFMTRAHVVAFQVKVCHVESDAILLGCFDLPHTVFVWWVEVGEGGTLDGAIRLVDIASACIYKSK